MRHRETRIVGESGSPTMRELLDNFGYHYESGTHPGVWWGLDVDGFHVDLGDPEGNHVTIWHGDDFQRLVTVWEAVQAMPSLGFSIDAANAPGDRGARLRNVGDILQDDWEAMIDREELPSRPDYPAMPELERLYDKLPPKMVVTSVGALALDTHGGANILIGRVWGHGIGFISTQNNGMWITVRKLPTADSRKADAASLALRLPVSHDPTFLFHFLLWTWDNREAVRQAGANGLVALTEYLCHNYPHAEFFHPWPMDATPEFVDDEIKAWAAEPDISPDSVVDGGAQSSGVL